MPKKQKTAFVCTECGVTHSEWSGRCFSCGAWNTIQEEIIETNSISKISSHPSTVTLLDNVSTKEESRILTGLSELDRVLGGGIVRGGVMLIGGEPGIGKSTLLLQICKALVENLKVLYVSGEESARQIKLRADRLNINNDDILFLF